MTWSITLSRYIAATTPRGIPMPVPRTIATVASSRVAGKTRVMSSITGLPLESEMPKSKVIAARR